MAEQSNTDEMVREHLVRRGLRDARVTDPATQALDRMLRDMLRLVEMACEDEHVPPDITARIMQRVMYGALPNPSDVERSQDLTYRLIDSTRRQMPTPEEMRRG